MNTSQSSSSVDSSANAPADRPRIVVGVDGSDPSLDALRTATRLAEALHASVEAVIAWSQPIAVSAYAVSLMPDLIEGARDTVETAADSVFGKNKPEWFSVAVREGSAAHVLITASEGAEMLVVGSRGHGGFAGLLLGSVSAECAEHAACPVLVVH
jgi:Universal stress protein UspA and related nucleotide-binding proteins